MRRVRNIEDVRKALADIYAILTQGDPIVRRRELTYPLVQSASMALSSDSAKSADALASATTTVNVSAATAPTTGQVLTATGSTTATWQDPGVNADSEMLPYFLMGG